MIILSLILLYLFKSPSINSGILTSKLVLLDEPLSALDVYLRKNLAEEIKNMQQKLGFTAIMVTHDLDEAKMMSDSIIAIKNGTKKWEGESKDFNPQVLC